MLKINIRFLRHSMEDRRTLQAHVEKKIPAVVLIPPAVGDSSEASDAEQAKVTSRVATYQVLEISQEGCTFSASSPERFTPGVNLQVRIVADGLVMEIDSRVVAISPGP